MADQPTKAATANPGGSTNKTELITANNISIKFSTGAEDIQVLKDVNFNISDNSFNIIYGPSGSGKSTLLNILTGLQPPSSGNISFDGKSVYDLAPDELARFRANRIGIVYQQNYWVHSLNVVENVALPLYFLGYAKSLAADLALLSLERVGMLDYAKKYPTLLSGGEQQRVAVARALVNDPRFVIADEPTGSLDSKNGDKIIGLLSKIKSEYRRTVILVTHNMEYLSLADHLLHIQDGQVQELRNESIKRTTDALMEEMKSRITELSKLKQADGAS